MYMNIHCTRYTLDIVLFLFTVYIVLRRSQGLDGGDAADSDDDEEGAVPGVGSLAAVAEGDGEDEDEDEAGDGAAAMDAEVEAEAPRLDPDGWETVVRGKKAKGRK
jgi:hypothetical protein